MILDSLNNASKYFHLNSYFKQAFEFIQKKDLVNMKSGKYFLDGDNLYLSIAEIDGKEQGSSRIEAHKKYIDIQIVLCGQETMGWKPLELCTHEIDSYNSIKDITFFTDRPSTYFTVNPDEFTVFFPEDGHAPAIGNGPIKKVVVKVLA
jgi:biofilm protein TabA